MRLSKKIIVILLVHLLLGTYISYSQEYKALWDNINKNNRKEALEELQGKLKSNKISLDEYLTYNFLMTFDGRERDITDFLSHISKDENANSYIYALWFSEPVAGEYGIKKTSQLNLLNHLVRAKPGASNGTLRAAAHYSLGHHYVRSNQFQNVRKENLLIGALTDWQMVGPFNNISGSGFNKNYEPVNDPSNSSVFLSRENAPINWFTPMEKSTEGWIFTGNSISESSGSITFAQTFVKSEVAQSAYINIGFAGNIKLWVNDQLLISVPEEKVTELDAFTSKCNLNAGYNRILIQVGSDNTDPNFIVRITDSNYEPLVNITSIAEPQQYQKAGGEAGDNMVPLFAETYFREKINKEPDNLINYMLLNRTYLRNKKVFEARKTIEKALKIAPDNTLLKYELILCYLQENNRTGISELYEYFKEQEKDCLISYVIFIEELKAQEKYNEALEKLEERIRLYGSDASTYDSRIQLLSRLNDAPRMLEVIDEAYKKYPGEAIFVNYVFNVEKSVNKNPKKALKILENFLQTHYNYQLTQLLIKEYYGQNNIKKPYQIIQRLIDTWPYDPSMRMDMLKEYLAQQRYTEAYDLCNLMLKMKPFSGYYYENKAIVEEALKKNQDAIESYKKALLYQPTLYDSRDKLRKLLDKKSLFEIAPQTKIEDLISKTGKNVKAGNYDYYFLQWEVKTILYPEGAREEEIVFAVKMLNQYGIDKYNETTCDYDRSIETLIIEDAQLVKANGKKIKPEITDNVIVWAGLEVNDIIYVKYKKRYYNKGKFAQEFYDNFVFDGFVPIDLSRYTLIVPESKKINYSVINGSVEPQISSFESYKMYVWQKDTIAAMEEEPYMPSTCDVAATLHISTMKDWNEIAQWYSDVVYSKIAFDEDYEVTETFNKLFEGKETLSAKEKAKIIYKYITENISYSSLAFRQSNIIPQRASTTINTRLGDCKDFSTLFVSLANKCKLKSNLVLVSTRDNGKKDMILPSFQFDHCIVKYYDEKDNEHYLELTSRDIPFGSLPYNLYQANSLTIPSKEDKDSKYTLAPVSVADKTVDKVVTKSKINISGNDMNIAYTNVRYGNMTSWTRNSYKSLSQENAVKKMQESMGKQFVNPVKVSSVSFIALDTLVDSVKTTVDMSVSNEVKKIGAQAAFTVPFFDVIVSASPFNLEKRNFDFEYWQYEYADTYETVVEINLPADKVFVEIPKGQKLTFNKTAYEIQYVKSLPNRLTITRKVHVDRNNITPADYPKFKEFVSKIVDLEGTYVTFK